MSISLPTYALPEMWRAGDRKSHWSSRYDTGRDHKSDFNDAPPKPDPPKLGTPAWRQLAHEDIGPGTPCMEVVIRLLLPKDETAIRRLATQVRTLQVPGVKWQTGRPMYSGTDEVSRVPIALDVTARVLSSNLDIWSIVEQALQSLSLCASANVLQMQLLEDHPFFSKPPKPCLRDLLPPGGCELPEPKLTHSVTCFCRVCEHKRDGKAPDT